MADAVQSRREAVLSKWTLAKKETGTAETALSRVMTREGIIPTEWTAQREYNAGLYPDIEDPEFSEKLTKKKLGRQFFATFGSFIRI